MTSNDATTQLLTDSLVEAAAGFESAPEGIRRVRRHSPTVKIFAAAIDRALNSRGFILPGLGDAGDRLFGEHPRG